jgi:hypothetical protein
MHIVRMMMHVRDVYVVVILDLVKLVSDIVCEKVQRGLRR